MRGLAGRFNAAIVGTTIIFACLAVLAARAEERAESGLAAPGDLLGGTLILEENPHPLDNASSRQPLLSCNTTLVSGGQGTSGNERAPNSNFLSGQAHYLITPAEMAASAFPLGGSPQDITWGNITGGIPATGSLKIYLENTTDTTNVKSETWATAISTMTLVSDNPTQSLPITAGTWTAPFVGGSTFTYTGGGLYIAFEWLWAGPVTQQVALLDCSVALTNGLKGAQGDTPSPTVTASSFRPFTRLNPVVGAANDVSVDFVRSYGAVPILLASPHSITAVVTNRGTNALSNVSVTLAITGADGFDDEQVIADLPPCGGLAVATFNSWTSSLPIGSDTATVSVPADDNNGNNSKSKVIEETNDRYSYKHPGSTPSGGFGFRGSSGALVAAFSTSIPVKVSEVELQFDVVTPTRYRVAIYGDNAGTPSTTALYVDAADRSVTAAGPVTIVLPAAVNVPAGRFYVGIHQTNNFNANWSYDSESPLRANTFFLATLLPPTSWSEFPATISFKPTVGIKLAACVDCAESSGTVSNLAATRQGSDVVLSWTPSCAGSDTDYAVYQGTSFPYNHQSVACTTAGATSYTVSPAASPFTYFLVVPRGAISEGSYGKNSSGMERPQGGTACSVKSVGCE